MIDRVKSPCEVLRVLNGMIENEEIGQAIYDTMKTFESVGMTVVRDPARKHVARANRSANDYHRIKNFPPKQLLFSRSKCPTNIGVQRPW